MGFVFSQIYSLAYWLFANETKLFSKLCLLLIANNHWNGCIIYYGVVFSLCFVASIYSVFMVASAELQVAKKEKGHKGM